jgi:hypothetical protein
MAENPFIYIFSVIVELQFGIAKSHVREIRLIGVFFKLLYRVIKPQGIIISTFQPQVVGYIPK